MRFVCVEEWRYQFAHVVAGLDNGVAGLACR